MLDFIADLSTTIITILFPIFASYKALRTSDPAQLAPWLMYWVVISLALVFESFFSFALVWTPFYAWLRLFARLYLILPNPHGATYIYQTYVYPFLVEHESDIDKSIGKAYDRAKSAGLQYAKKVLEYIRANVFGMPGKPSSPSAKDEPAVPAGDFYSLLASALQLVTASGALQDLDSAGDKKQ